MITTAIIAFREFLEAFLIVGVFFGISRRMGLKKEGEILLSAACGIIISLLLATLTYLFGDQARSVLSEKNADFLESYLLIFSGIFIAYVVFSLHDTLKKGRGETLVSAHRKLEKDVFDASLFFTIVFLVLREGFEVALFTASVSLFSAFTQNFIGLLAGFALASLVGVATFFAYVRFPIGKIFKFTQYAIIILGAGLIQNGITKLFETHFGISLSAIFSLPLQFLPDEDTFAGHMLQGLLGIDNEFSLVRLFIMIAYVFAVYFIFVVKRKKKMTREY